MTPPVRNGMFVWSDTHFGHKGITKFGLRPETHEIIMLDNWCRMVSEGADILHLGDVFMGRGGNPERWARVVRRMPGRKWLVKGNHDRDDDTLYEIAGFTVVEPFIHDRIAFTHEPLSTTYQLDGFPLYAWDVNVHGHVHGGWCARDGDPLPEKRYVNACVEMLNLAPWRLGTLLSRARVL